MSTKRLTDADLRAAKAKEGQRIELWDAQQLGLCLRVSQSRKTWLVRYRADGKQRRYIFGEYPDLDLVAARAKAAVLLRDTRRGADPAKEERQRKAQVRTRPIKTLRDLAEAYVLACQNGHWKPRGKPQGERTLRDLRESLDRYVLPELGDLALAEVTRVRVRQFLRELAGRGIGAQTNKAVSALRRIYNWAIAEFEGKVVAVNVAANHPREVEAPRARTLRDLELRLFWATLADPGELRLPPEPGESEGHLVSLSRRMAIALQLLGLLLQRPKEIAGMMAAEIDLDQGLWLVPAERMKARKAHLVPLPPAAVELIREALKLAESLQIADEAGQHPTDFPVFPSPRDPTRPILGSSMSKTMREVFVAIGIKGAVLYDLRRTGSTAMTSERLGISPFIRSLVLSHTTDTGGGAAVSTRHYDTNDYVAEKRRALEAWERLILEIASGETRASNVRQLARS